MVGLGQKRKRRHGRFSPVISLAAFEHGPEQAIGGRATTREQPVEIRTQFFLGPLANLAQSVVPRPKSAVPCPQIEGGLVVVFLDDVEQKR